MGKSKREWGTIRGVGKYKKSGQWSDYWRTKISCADEKECIIRGYTQEDIIENLTYPETLFLTLKGELPTEKETRVFNAVLNGIPDHQFIASNVPAARYVASAFPESPIPGLAAGVLIISLLRQTFLRHGMLPLRFLNRPFRVLQQVFWLLVLTPDLLRILRL